MAICFVMFAAYQTERSASLLRQNTLKFFFPPLLGRRRVVMRRDRQMQSKATYCFPSCISNYQISEVCLYPTRIQMEPLFFFSFSWITTNSVLTWTLIQLGHVFPFSWVLRTRRPSLYYHTESRRESCYGPRI